jgi:uncharacterized membrane protein
MKKTYQIRYNTQSKDDSTSWRLICDNEEILVEDVYIDAQTYTSKDWIEELKQHKYHISCTGNLLIKDNVAFITTNDRKKNVKVHLAKTISYRILATVITVLTALILGLNIEASALLGFGEIMIKPVFYFFHERVWHKIVLNNNKST